MIWNLGLEDTISNNQQNLLIYHGSQKEGEPSSNDLILSMRLATMMDQLKW